MIVLGAGLAGVLSGLLTARRRGGNRLDRAQYAAGFGIAFALLGLIVTVMIDRSL
jgi:hypothetical protein